MGILKRLDRSQVYLVGAMDRVPDGGTNWRQRITPFLKEMGVTVINPCEKPVHNVSEDDDTRYWIEYYKETEQYDKIKEKFSIIRCADLRCVDVSDFIIAHIDLDVHACGTYEEIVTANRQKKPILIWCEQGKKQAPNWLFFMLPHRHIFSNLDEIILYLQNIHSSPSINHDDRWIFFNRT